MMSELFDEEVLRKQYDIAERRIAREEGETLLGKLVATLLGLGRTEDALKVSTDAEYRQQLYVEFGLV